MDDILFKQVILPSGRKKYVPCGIYEMELPTGIFFVDIRKNAKEVATGDYISRLYKLGDPKPIDLSEICGLHQLANRVMETKEFRELMSKSCSASDIVAKTIAIINSFKNK